MNVIFSLLFAMIHIFILILIHVKVFGSRITPKQMIGFLSGPRSLL